MLRPAQFLLRRISAALGTPVRARRVRVHVRRRVIVLEDVRACVDGRADVSAHRVIARVDVRATAPRLTLRDLAVQDGSLCLRDAVRGVDTLELVSASVRMHPTAAGDYDVAIRGDACAGAKRYPLGPLRVEGTVCSAASLSELARKPLTLRWELGPHASGSVRAETLRSRTGAVACDVEIAGPALSALSTPGSGLRRVAASLAVSRRLAVHLAASVHHGQMTIEEFSASVREGPGGSGG